MSAVARIIEEINGVRTALRGVSSKQVWSLPLKVQIRNLASGYFTNLRPLISGDIVDELNLIFENLHTSSRGNPSTQKCKDLVKEARKKLILLEGQVVSKPVLKAVVEVSADTLIIGTLNDICPTASFAYQQALIDHADRDRLSWRGPSTDLREALRETLDVLAPDADVSGSQGFKLEPDAKRPTMKQKVRHVLRSRKMPSGAIGTPETAVEGIEELLGRLTRSVYTRSSVSTHTASTREEAVRVLHWVRLVLCEVLEVPL